MNLKPFFESKKIAVIGASRNPSKVGHVVVKQLLGKNFQIYPVNPNAQKILGLEVYPNISELPSGIELAVIAIPSKYVSEALDLLGLKKIQHVIIISAGFKETGNSYLEEKLQKALCKNNITCIGPNCLGVFDAHTKLDVLFLPKERLQRPRPGSISFISQSGATGSAVLDLAAYENYGFAKFISYGNAANVDESDLLDYLSNDFDTKVICMYVEGIKDGKKFIKIAKSCKKPIIILKGGVSRAGCKATLSHTGSLAGEAKIYYGAFKQCGIIIAHTLEEVFEYAKAFDKIKKKAKGKRIQIITNGGGFGILCADALERHGLELATPGKSITNLKSKLKSTVVVGNPFDVLGDATNQRFKKAIDATVADNNNDAIVLVVLTQTPLIDEGMVDIIEDSLGKSDKPIVLVLTGSNYTQTLKRHFEAVGAACFTFPDNAIRALKEYLIHPRT